MADAPHSCRGCPARWGGALACHCSRCHLTLSGITIFDLHQVGLKCLTIRQLKAQGVLEVRPGVYGRPTPTQEGIAGVSKRPRDARGRLA